MAPTLRDQRGDATMDGGDGTWSPDAGAIEFAVWPDPGGHGPTTLLARHPTAPFIRQVDLTDGAAVRRAADEYIAAIAGMVGGALNPARTLLERRRFDWLPDGGPGAADPMRRVASQLVENLGPDGHSTGRSLVLLAGEKIGNWPLGSELGIRVVVHDLPWRLQEPWIRINGLSASLPLDPDAEVVEVALARQLEREFGGESGLLDASRQPLAHALAMDAGTISYRGLRFRKDADDRTLIELRGRGLGIAGGPGAGDPHEIFAEIRVAADAPRFDGLVQARKVPLRACGLPPQPPVASVFRCDPASRAGLAVRRLRPRRRAELEPWREPEEQRVPLRLPNGLADILQTRFVPGDNPANGVKSVPLPDPALAVRSNAFTAVSAFRNVRELFRRFDLYGIQPQAYFRHAGLPLKVYYRSGIRPGPGKDGRTINGQVLPEGWERGVTAAGAQQVVRPSLELHLALGDLLARDRRPWDGQTPSRATPIGFAADPRWVWHEAAHILLMAALGEPEFRFAHSMGDALAAIVSDPASALSSNRRARGATFPWVFAPRRHDRCVLHGWGWEGLLGRAARQTPFAQRVQGKGYITEQIISTTMFRMYRCLGGDSLAPQSSVADVAMRGHAAAHAVFLIMDSLQLLGDPLIVPATRAELFAAALMDADERTETVRVDAAGIERVGGCAHKAIRWAFEAQGMYAGQGDEPTAPGRPPQVDVFIADNRELAEEFPDARVVHGVGSYVPVSLDWAGLTGGAISQVLPPWFARAADMQANAGQLEVNVGNRGTGQATAVTLRLWMHPWAESEPYPDWDATTWTLCGTAPAQDIPGGGTRLFHVALPGSAAGRHLLLAEAVCAADRANIDPAAGLACGRRPVPLNLLVPLDNNLGLTVLG